ncbi:unnamed protein product [Arabidopsis halleri]
MGELREVTVQYTSCADPTESLARKQRVLQGKSRGLMAETAAQILASSSLPIPSNIQQLEEPPLSLDVPIHPAEMSLKEKVPLKKKRGRPPLIKPTNKSPLKLPGAKSSKRNLEIIHNSPKRKSNEEELAPTREENQAPPQRKPAKQRLSLPGDEAEMNKIISPDIIFLMETKNNDDFTLKKLQGLQFPSCKLIPPLTRGGGGQALLWNQMVELEVLDESPNFIDTFIKAEGRSFHATFVYGEPERTKRKEIWSKLSSIGQSRSGPWWLTGDFNDIVDSLENQGGAVRPEGSFVDLRTLMSRQLWLTLGDKNTGYFHAITKGRKATNKFSVIESEAGDQFFEEDKFLGVILDYYNQLFTMQDLNGEDRLTAVQEALIPCITAETNSALISIPSAAEIKVACFSIHADKAPGPDGFSASFFQTTWNTTQLGRVVGNGTTTRLWHDPWISLSSPQRPMGPAPAHTQDCMVSELISPESLDWDREKVRQTFPELEQEILGLRLSSLGAVDAYAWLPSKTGTYTAKSGYYEYLKAEVEPTQNQCQEENKGFNWSKEIWNIKSTPKMKFLLWKAMRGALPLGENLKARKIAIATGCPFCGEEESALHLFFKCSFANSIWKLAPFKTSITGDRLSSFREGIEASKLLDKTAIPMETLVHAIIIAKEWQQAQEHVSESNHKPLTQVTRSRVEAGTFYCQTDAAWIESQRAAGFGWILSNRLENFRQEGSATSLHIRSPLMAEIVAIHLALQHALSLGITNLSIALDSKQAIEAIKSKQPSKELHGILHDILILSLNFCKISFNFIPRGENQEADALAKSSLKTLVSEP